MAGAWALAVGALELAHELDERLDAFAREGVVDGGAYAADRAVAFEAVKARGRRLIRKLLLQLFARQPERDVHDRARVRVGVAAVEVGRVNRVVQQLRLLFVLAAHANESALALKPI